MLQAGPGLWIPVLSVAILLWLWASLAYWRALRKGFDRLVSDLHSLEAGDNTRADFKGFGRWLAEPLSRISKLLQKQEADLQSEKLRRLRSVVDGQDQERTRLSRELHDSVGQSLIAVKLQLEHAATLNYSQMRAGIDMAKNMTDQTLEEVRRVCNDLMPASLSEFGLETALRTRCNELGALGGFRVEFASEGSLERLDKKSKIYLYRIAQEALNNIVKHARATAVSLRLERKNEVATLRITDNGKGFIFDPLSFSNRNGLQNMRERAHLLQGSFEIDSTPGHGTTITVKLPYITGNEKD